jgi:hypothetical protein
MIAFLMLISGREQAAACGIQAVQEAAGGGARGRGARQQGPREGAQEGQQDREGGARGMRENALDALLPLITHFKQSLRLRTVFTIEILRETESQEVTGARPGACGAQPTATWQRQQQSRPGGPRGILLLSAFGKNCSCYMETEPICSFDECRKSTLAQHHLVLGCFNQGRTYRTIFLRLKSHLPKASE